MQLRNWAGNVVFSTERLHRPTTVAELQELVAAEPRIRALGTGHSFSRIADSTGALVSTAGLDGTITLDEATRTVSLPAGIRYAELATAVHARGYALANLGSLPHISIAGACATGTHGSGDDNPCLAAAASAVEFVRADGELVRLSRGDASFPGAVVALGALGVVTRLALDVEPAFEVRQDVWLDLPVDAAAEHVQRIMAAGYSVSLFTSWTRPDVIDKVWVKRRAGVEAGVDPAQWGATPATVAQHPITGQDVAAATEQLGVVGAWYERLPHFRLAFTPSTGDEQQSEYLVARERAGDAIRALRGAADRFAAPLLVCELRTVAADDLWLSPCHGRDTFALHFTWAPDVPRSAIAALEDALAPLEPRPHWGKVFLAGRDEVAGHYPRLPDFRALAATHDPDRKFGNAFLDEYVYP